MRGRTIWLLGLLVLLLPLLAACGAREAATEVGILGYNHTGRDIPQFTINGGNGGSAWRHAEGGTVCCALMPDQWKPGMDVQVRALSAAGEVLAEQHFDLEWRRVGGSERCGGPHEAGPLLLPVGQPGTG